jgi:16S rRNA (guanine966-N2)-methyltransferase
VRVIGGEARGRRLAVPPGRGTRPTSDRVREALFSTLQALTDLAGARVLDLYAGSGALGVEARSRGAAHATFVESDVRAAAVIRRNCESTELDDSTWVVRADRVERVVASPADAPYDVAFLDPPYVIAGDVVTNVLGQLVAGGWLGDEAVVVVERATRGPQLGWPSGLADVQQRRYGDVTLWYGRRAVGPGRQGGDS